jgi:hypothetical protein
MNERLFWKNTKENRDQVSEILNRFRSTVPSNISLVFQEIYERFKKYDYSLNKLKNIYND